MRRAKRYWISDTHVGHRLVAGQRGFASVQEHDQTLLQNINQIVRDGDVVNHLGDVGIAPDDYTLEWVLQLNGTWNLVTGNHDSVWPGHRRQRGSQREWMQYFASVQPFGHTYIGDYEVLMSHFPYEGDHTEFNRYTQYRLRNEDKILVAGHTHKSDKVHGYRQINVCPEAWNLAPASESELLQLIRSKREEWQLD
jgi:calcineurin-like phosphoesterase family protein